MDKNVLGLTLEEVKKSREKYGDNSLSKTKSNSLFKLFIESLGDPIIKILLIALGIKVIFLFKDFDIFETVGIVIAILLASFISTVSEYGSEKAFKKMQEEASKSTTKVKRNGKIMEISVDEVVTGDIIILEQGDKVPADGILIDGSVTVDESSLNGESKEKHKEKVINNITDKNKVYRGSVIYSGRSLMKVCEVGTNTIYGKMSKELSEKSPDSPLKIRLNKLALTISKIGYVGAVLVFISYLFSKVVIENNFEINKIMETLTSFDVMFGYILYALTLCVTIIVVAVPEGLPMMITLVLSSNMKRMLKDNVLVRKMTGIETAGSINVLFSDKTGTITKGKLEVTEIMSGFLKKYNNETEIMINPKYYDIVRESICYNTESNYTENGIIGGNITDRAILSFIKNTPKNINKLDIIPFDSKNKYSATKINNGKTIYLIKGAFEKILQNCTYYYNENGFKKPFITKKEVSNYCNNLSNNGSRMLVLAIKESNILSFNDLVFVGAICIKDEIRPEAIEGIKLVKEASIKTIMLTGDNKNTALSIAKEVGLVEKETDIVLTSSDLEKMTDDEIRNIFNDLKVVARSLPTDKTRLIKIAQSLNLVTGMTGDGVNDAPSLKISDVGFAMGSGTSVAKEAADIVILDDNFLSISKAILYGRTIFKSIRKFIICQLTVNLCAIFLSFIGPFIGVPTPVTVIQMLWVNMVMDTLTGLAFAFEPALLEYMKEKPKKRDENIINKYMFEEIFVTGIYSSILCILFLKLPFIKKIYENNTNYLLSAFFALFIFIDIFNSFNARTHRLNLLANIFKNKVFLTITLFIATMQIILIYFGGDLFRTTSITFIELQITILLAFTVIPVDFIRKLLLRKKGLISGV